MALIVKTIKNFNLNFETVHEKIIKNLDNDQLFKITDENQKIIDHIKVNQLIDHDDKTIALASSHEKINLKTSEKQVRAKIYIHPTAKFNLDKFKSVLSIYGLVYEKITKIHDLNEKDFENIRSISFEYKEIENKIHFDNFDSFNIYSLKAIDFGSRIEEEIKNNDYLHKLLMVHDVLENYYSYAQSLTNPSVDLSINFKLIQKILSIILIVITSKEFEVTPRFSNLTSFIKKVSSSFPDLKSFIKKHKDKSCLVFAEGFEKLMKRI